jgi:hypothetical protein
MRSEIAACALAMGMLTAVSVFAQDPSTKPDNVKPYFKWTVIQLIRHLLRIVPPTRKADKLLRDAEALQNGTPANLGS